MKSCLRNRSTTGPRPVRMLAKWGLGGLGAAVVLVGLYLSVYFFPYPFFPHHIEHAGFSVYSDREIPKDFGRILDDARFRVAAMEVYRGATHPRLFVCQSQRLFVLLVKLAGKRYVGQALVISAAGNIFLSEEGIESIGQRNGGRPEHSRLQGSWSAAIAHEVAHVLVASEVGSRRARKIPQWKSEGYADYAANLASVASDPDYDFVNRVDLLLDADNWRPPVTTFDRRHFRWHLIVEYLCSVRDVGFADLLDDAVTEMDSFDEMMAWHDAVQTR